MWKAADLGSSYSIAYGVIAGISSYILLSGLPWILRKISGDRIVPVNYGEAEPWVIPPGGIVPVWMSVLTLFFGWRMLLNYSVLGNMCTAMPLVVLTYHRMLEVTIPEVPRPLLMRSTARPTLLGFKLSSRYMFVFLCTSYSFCLRLTYHTKLSF